MAAAASAIETPRRREATRQLSSSLIRTYSIDLGESSSHIGVFADHRPAGAGTARPFADVFGEAVEFAGRAEHDTFVVEPSGDEAPAAALPPTRIDTGTRTSL